jgi:hypothetical protein
MLIRDREKESMCMMKGVDGGTEKLKSEFQRGWLNGKARMNMYRD